MKVLIEFYDRESKTMDLVLGDGGTAKMLNGRKPYYEMFNDIMEALEPLEPIFKKGYENVKNKIVEKYKIKDTDVMEG